MPPLFTSDTAEGSEAWAANWDYLGCGFDDFSPSWRTSAALVVVYRHSRRGVVASVDPRQHYTPARITNRFRYCLDARVNHAQRAMSLGSASHPPPAPG